MYQEVNMSAMLLEGREC